MNQTSFNERPPELFINGREVATKSITLTSSICSFDGWMQDFHLKARVVVHQDPFAVLLSDKPVRMRLKDMNHRCSEEHIEREWEAMITSMYESIDGSVDIETVAIGAVNVFTSEGTPIGMAK